VQTGLDASTSTTQAGIATTQAGIATTQAGISTTQAGIATTQASNALTSAAAALASETDAETAASTATTQAGIATTQAGIATTQAGIATTQAGNALTSANNAAASAAAAAQVGTSTLLTGFSTGANSTILATDTILQGFNKTQGQINARVAGTGASGQVAFWNGTSSQTGDNGLFWDNTNKSLGIGLTNPQSKLHIGMTGGNAALILSDVGAPNTLPSLIFRRGPATANSLSLDFPSNLRARFTIGDAITGIEFVSTPIFLTGGQSIQFGGITGQTATAILGSIHTDNNNGQLLFSTRGSGVTSERMRVNNLGNLLIGTTTDAGFRLDVNGTARVQGVLTTTADAVVNGVNIGIGGGAVTTNTRVGANALRDNTTGTNNTAFGINAGLLNTTGLANSFFGQGAGQGNTTGASNSFFGQRSGEGNTVGGSNSFFGTFAGFANTTGGSNSYFGVNAAFNISSGNSNIVFGQNAGRFIADGTTSLTVLNNSVLLGSGSRANANSETNQIAIGANAIGLGSNTTVIGNSSTTHGRWYGSLLLGTTTNAASSILTMESTTQGFLPPRMTTTQRNAIASPATGLMIYNSTDNLVQAYNGTSWINL
jgi:hypothetical protein